MTDDLGELVEVAPERAGQLRRLVIALLGIGVALGVIFGLASWLVGTFSQTEQGLCRVTPAPCAELSVGSVESLSGVDLPPGTEVLSGYAQELGTLREFRAVVELPLGGSVSMSSAYESLDSLTAAPAAARDLENTSFWTRPVHDPDGHDLAVVGTRANGHTVVVFDERQVPRTP
jgi:hypothetical protein